MDAALKDDIANEFRKEYFADEKKKESRFWQGFHKLNRIVDKTLNRLYLDLPSFAVVSTALLFAAAPHLGLLALGVWGVDAGMAAYSNIACRTRGEGRIWKDIDNGILPERYNQVLDSRIKGLSEKLELYTAQKAQLPPVGAAQKAFAEAAHAAPVAPAPAVPAPLPAAAPKP